MSPKVEIFESQAVGDVPATLADSGLHIVKVAQHLTGKTKYLSMIARNLKLPTHDSVGIVTPHRYFD